jgi:hypothetical protein
MDDLILILICYTVPGLAQVHEIKEKNWVTLRAFIFFFPYSQYVSKRQQVRHKQ